MKVSTSDFRLSFNLRIIVKLSSDLQYMPFYNYQMSKGILYFFDIFDGVLFVLFFSPRDVLDEI